MKKKQKNKAQKPISTEVVPNAPAPVSKTLNTMTDFYQHYYTVLFNKLGKEEQESLTNNLKRGAQIVRGSSIEFPNVRAFIRDVIEKAEFEYDHFQEKQKKALDKK